MALEAPPPPVQQTPALEGVPRMAGYVAAQQGNRPFIIPHLGPCDGLIAGQILLRIDLGVGGARPREHMLGTVTETRPPQRPSHQNPPEPGSEGPLCGWGEAVGPRHHAPCPGGIEVSAGSSSSHSRQSTNRAVLGKR